MSAAAPDTLAPATVLEALDASLEADLMALLAFTRIPSVSADPRHGGDVRAAADHLATRLRGAGPLDVSVMPADGNPVVCARWHGAQDAPTIVIYGHYDVQPADLVVSADGGIANPLHALAQLIAGLHDADGRVSVDGLYDGVAPLPPSTREATRALPFDEAAYLAEVGAPALYGEAGYSTL